MFAEKSDWVETGYIMAGFYLSQFRPLTFTSVCLERTGMRKGTTLYSAVVGVYRLVDFLAGYHLPLFSTNSTVESKLGYQPIPASYSGSPLASIYYVTNDSISTV